MVHFTRSTVVKVRRSRSIGSQDNGFAIIRENNNLGGRSVERIRINSLEIVTTR